MSTATLLYTKTNITKLIQNNNKKKIYIYIYLCAITIANIEGDIPIQQHLCPKQFHIYFSNVKLSTVRSNSLNRRCLLSVHLGQAERNGFNS